MNDEEGYQKKLAEFEASVVERKRQKAESGEISEPNHSTPSPAVSPSSTSTTNPPLTEASAEVQNQPLVTESTRAGKVETKNTTNHQNNNVNIENNVTINGSDAPEEVANRTVEKLDDGTRYIPSAVVPDVMYGGAN